MTRNHWNSGYITTFLFSIIIPIIILFLWGEGQCAHAQEWEAEEGEIAIGDLEEEGTPEEGEIVIGDPEEGGEAEEESVTDILEAVGPIDSDEIQRVMDELQIGGGRSFDGYVRELATEGGGVSFRGLVQDVLSAAGNELAGNRNTMARLLLIAVVAAVFANFTKIFHGKQMSETGFYVTYMLLFTILITSFLSITAVAQNALQDLQGFMKALIPAYLVALAYTVGASTSTVFYQATMFLIAIVDTVLIGVVIPAVRVFFVLSLTNHLLREERFSKMMELIMNVITWGLKTLLGLVVGFHTIQGLVVPALDGVKRSTITKVVGSVPGLGGLFGTAAETVVGAGLLVKNAIGVAGLVVIVSLCAVPLAKLLVYTLTYRLSAAIVQPISDKRILACIGATADSAKLLLLTVLVGAVMFLFSITIVTAMTGRL